MTDKSQSSSSPAPFSWRFVRNVIVKTIVLFAACNLLFLAAGSGESLGRNSLYNRLYPGRERLPWSENPEAAYNLSLNNLDAMFASHRIAGDVKGEQEFRVVVIGDSSVWGFLLSNQESLTGQLNQLELETGDGKSIEVYNLGYPTISLTKDLVLLDRALAYQPDLIVWMVTLESFPYHKQIFTPLVENNPKETEDLISQFQLNLDPQDEGFVRPGTWQQTLVGQRRALADLFRLQMYGFMWAATGIDQDIPESYDLRQEDFEADLSYYSFNPPKLTESDLAFDVLAAGVSLAGEVPILIVNEPIFISAGENSEIRYNYIYPRWAYDSYRQLLAEVGQRDGWLYLDTWDLIPAEEFTNTAIHISPQGTQLLAEEIGRALIALINGEQIQPGVELP